MKDYLQRASSLGSIISKSGKMTAGIESYLLERFVEKTTGNRKEITSKYFEKGIACEQDILNLVNKVFFKNTFITSTKAYKSNKYICGTADLVHNNVVFDMKAAWDDFTFHKADISWNYEWQLRAYMNLWGLKKAFLVYGLVDMPEHLLTRERQTLFYKGKYLDYDDPEYINDCEELNARYSFNDRPPEQRLRLWEIDARKEDADIIKEAVENARVILEQMKLNRKNEINNIIKLSKNLKNGNY